MRNRSFQLHVKACAKATKMILRSFQILKGTTEGARQRKGAPVVFSRETRAARLLAAPNSLKQGIRSKEMNLRVTCVSSREA